MNGPKALDNYFVNYIIPTNVYNVAIVNLHFVILSMVPKLINVNFEIDCFNNHVGLLFSERRLPKY